MKKRNIILALLPFALTIFTLNSCKVDDGTITVYHAFTTPVLTTTPAVRADETVLFTGSTVALNWGSKDADGDPGNWNVYFGTDPVSPALFKSALAANTISVPVVDGTTYYWYVEVVDANKVKTKSEISSFTAVNGKNPEISMNLNVTTDVLAAIGLDLTPDQTVDLRLMIFKKSDLSVVKIVDDGNANESYGEFSTLPDGEYVVGVDIFSTINAGDFNKVVKLSMSLQFDQLGILNQKLDFPNVMTNANPCSLYRTYLASVKKVGAVYTIASAVSYLAPSVLTWKGTDADYTSQVKTTESCAGKTMTGLGFDWMLDWWGEKITSGGTLSYTISGSTITIPLQKYCKTTYNGAAQPEYSIKGTGTINNSGAYPVYTIQYDFIQSGASIATICLDYGWPTNYFEAVITTKP